MKPPAPAMTMRSSCFKSGLVAAVNAVFEHAEAQRHPEGAFRFGLDAQGRPRLPFGRVDAQGRVDRIAAGGAAVPALTIALDRVVRVLRILDLGERRGPAREAATLYESLEAAGASRVVLAPSPQSG